MQSQDQLCKIPFLNDVNTEWEWLRLALLYLLKPRKFYVRRDNNKVDSIWKGRTVIADLFPWSDLEKCI